MSSSNWGMHSFGCESRVCSRVRRASCGGMVSVAFDQAISDRQLRTVYRIWARLAARGRLPACDDMIFASLSRLPPPILLWAWMPCEGTFRFALDAQGAGLPSDRNLPGRPLEELCSGERH